MGIFRRIVVPVLKGTAALGVVGTGLVLIDVRRKKVYPSQPFSEALRHYITIKALSCLGASSRKSLEAASKDVAKSQAAYLQAQLMENSSTDYGRHYKFIEIRDPDVFRQRHPLTRYAHYQPYIERMMLGDGNVMTRYDPALFAVTSGTSGTASIIPMLHKQSRIFLTKGVAIAISCIADTFPESTNLHKGLKIMFTPTWRKTKSGIQMGPNSSTPDSLRKVLFMYTTPEPVFEIRSEPDALYAHLLFALSDSNVGIIEANFASLIYHAFRTLESELPKLIKDIAEGTLNPDLDIPADIRATLEERLVANPKRAAEIDKAWQDGGVEGVAKRLWPHLQVTLCTDSGAFALYGDKLRATFLKDVPIYSPLYAASEGLLGINIWPKDLPSKYLLHPQAMFFELIPVDKTEEDQPETILLQEAEIGEMYEVVITNASGLYRYRLGDVVKVCGFHHQAPIVEFMYRQGQFLNVRGEKLSEAVFYDSLMSAVKNWASFRLLDYCCIESVMLHDLNSKVAKSLQSRSPCYHVFLEIEGTPATLSKDQHKLMDAALGARSYPYQSFRAIGSIGEIQMHLVKPDTFQALKQFMVAKGNATPNQYKTPRVLKNKAAIEFVLERIV